MTWKVELVSTATQPTDVFETLQSWCTADGRYAWIRARSAIIQTFEAELLKRELSRTKAKLQLRQYDGYVYYPPVTRSAADDDRELTPDEIARLTALVDEARARLPPVPLPLDTIRVTSSQPMREDRVYEGKTVAEVCSAIDGLDLGSCALGVEIVRVAIKGGLS